MGDVVVYFKVQFLNTCYRLNSEALFVKWMSQNTSDVNSTLVQVIGWCHQATRHYLRQCWPRTMSPFDVTRPQGTNTHLLVMHGWCECISSLKNLRHLGILHRATIHIIIIMRNLTKVYHISSLELSVHIKWFKQAKNSIKPNRFLLWFNCKWQNAVS